MEWVIATIIAVVVFVLVAIFVLGTKRHDGDSVPGSIQFRWLQGKRTDPARGLRQDKMALIRRAFARICQKIVLLTGLTAIVRRELRQNRQGDFFK